MWYTDFLQKDKKRILKKFSFYLYSWKRCNTSNSHLSHLYRWCILGVPDHKSNFTSVHSTIFSATSILSYLGALSEI